MTPEQIAQEQRMRGFGGAVAEMALDTTLFSMQMELALWILRGSSADVIF